MTIIPLMVYKFHTEKQGTDPHSLVLLIASRYLKLESSLGLSRLTNEESSSVRSFTNHLPRSWGRFNLLPVHLDNVTCRISFACTSQPIKKNVLNHRKGQVLGLLGLIEILIELAKVMLVIQYQSCEWSHIWSSNLVEGRVAVLSVMHG